MVEQIEIVECETCANTVTCGYPCRDCDGSGAVILEILSDEDGNLDAVSISNQIIPGSTIIEPD